MTDGTNRKILPVVIGIAFTCAFLLLLAVLAQKRKAQQAEVPQLAIVAPAPNEAVDSVFVIRFTSTRPIALMASGWGYDQLHLHATLDDAQFMPAAADITQIDSITWTWTLHNARFSGTRSLRLGWADLMHRPIPEGASAAVPVASR